MSARALSRALANPATWIDLPTLEHPQYVDEDDYEVDEPPLELVEGTGVQEEVAEGGGDVEEVDEEVLDDNEDAEMEEAVVEDEQLDEGGEKQPLLGLADSLVLPYSLTQTRLHHLQHLFPHMFSHPPIPSHSKPRARGPPKSTFLFPTPPPPLQPLPLPEYHGPRKPADTPDSPRSPGSPTAVATGEQSETASIPSAAKGKGKASHKNDDVPAHEIDCIARVTLSIGPISFPGTELWVGRFVEPRAGQPRVARRAPGDKGQKSGKTGAGEKREKRRSLAEEAAMRRARKETSQGSPVTSGPFRPVGMPGPLGPGMRPPMTGPRPMLGPAPPPGAGTGSALPPRPNNIPPQLIQRVNLAATRHPWLSIIIHKAARSSASKEELAKLARVVQRLGRGEDVGEGPEEGITKPLISPRAAQPGPSTSTAAPRPPPQPSSTGPAVPSASSSATAQAPVTPKTEHEVQANKDNGDSSDEEVDMKGPPQVGGGPGPEPGSNPASTSASGLATPTAALPTTQSAPTSASAVAPSVRPPSAAPGIATVTGSPRPSLGLEAASSAASAPPVPQRPGEPNFRPPPSALPQTPGSIQRPPSITSSMPPPSAPRTPSASLPPRPTYPLLPRFLLVAFKEAPTEKYLIPLGAGSFISRVGGDFVTGPPPPPPSAVVEPPKPVVAPAALVSAASASVAPLAKVIQIASPSDARPETAGNGRGRTRQSHGRHAKEVPLLQAPVEKVAAEEKAKPVEKVKEEPKRKEVPTSGFEPLPSGSPGPGTVLISTVVPAKEWIKVDWSEMEKGLPWVNAALMRPRPTEVKQEPQPSPSDGQMPKSPSRSLRHVRAPAQEQTESQAKAKPMYPSLLNLAALDFMPQEGGLYPVTIRLSDVDDTTWRKMKVVMQEVDIAEMRCLSENEPDLVKDVMPPMPVPAVTPMSYASAAAQPTPNAPNTVISPSSAGAPGVSPAALVQSASAQQIPPRPPVAPIHPLAVPQAREILRLTLLSRKKSHFSSLLSRVRRRLFLRFRTEYTDPSLIDATADKWAPRPYPISTKPLYTRSPPPEDEEGVVLQLSPEKPAKRKKRNEEEDAVTFEMPVSLDALDERVEEGARTVLGRKRGRGGKAPFDDGRKRYGKRWKAGVLCEGCGKEGLKVWRRGPNGKATLCNQCGDKYLAGTLGELTAPGAASGIDEEVEAQADEVQVGSVGPEEQSGGEVKVEQQDSPLVPEGTTKVVDRTTTFGNAHSQMLTPEPFAMPPTGAHEPAASNTAGEGLPLPAQDPFEGQAVERPEPDGPQQHGNATVPSMQNDTAAPPPNARQDVALD